MSAIAATFTIWTNRAGGATRDGLHTAGVGQNDNHQRRSSADARWPGTGWDFRPQGYRSRMWTELSGQHYYDWLTEPAPPPANVLVSQYRQKFRGIGERVFSRVN